MRTDCAPTAEYYRDVFERAEGEAPARPAGEWLADYARKSTILRAALDWASRQTAMHRSEWR